MGVLVEYGAVDNHGWGGVNCWGSCSCWSRVQLPAMMILDKLLLQADLLGVDHHGGSMG